MLYYRVVSTNGIADHNSAATHLHFDGEVLINSSQLGNPPSLFAVFLLAHGYLTENVMHTGQVSHDVAASVVM